MSALQNDTPPANRDRGQGNSIATPPPSMNQPQPPSTATTPHAPPSHLPVISTSSTQPPIAATLISVLPSSAAVAAMEFPLGSSQYRPLNVKDALSYLDQVKNQFGDQPDVYNRFLDIMKEFKSQSIDTPGVINRVSSLFRGHSNLITGFNTFLPPGYRIEATNDPQNPIRVTTPPESDGLMYGGVSSTTPLAAAANSSSITVPPPPPPPPPVSLPGGYMHASHPPPASQPPGWYAGIDIDRPALLPILPTSASLLIPPSSQSHSSSVSGGTPLSLPPPPPSAAPCRNLLGITGTSLIAASLPSVSPAAVVSANIPGRAPMEFNHAISYVNKIMNRFAGERETYKQFLEILQTYQKEQKPIQEVYAQIAVLFKDHKDLLDEFKLFLPDTAPNNRGVAVPPNGMPQMRTVSDSKRSSAAVRKPSTKRPGSVAPLAPLVNQSAHHQQSRKKAKAMAVLLAGPPTKSQSVTGSSAAGSMPAGSSGPDEELEFFERAKRAIGNKTTYNEFLKVLNLFSQELIDIKTLVERVEPFLGWQPDLFEWFKKFVKFEDNEIIHNIPGPSRGLDLSTSRRSGRSYRQLPAEVPRPACSGRDELCKEVLNDDWISTPVYMSESGEIGHHKKTVYEEAIFNVESERYEFDINIEANIHTISILEHLAAQIQMMSAEDKAKLKLPPGLVPGGSKSIYQRIVKKVYEKERGLEVIEALHHNPAVAVPVVLRRLKQKDEEWKRAQREWNKVWRDIDIKNFYKSLDHQGVTFKNTDRKAISVKHLIQEIEILHREQRHRKSNLAVQHQYDFAFRYPQVFEDLRRLLLALIKASPMYTEQDHERVRNFLSLFIPAFFLLDKVHEHDGAGYYETRNNIAGIDSMDFTGDPSMDNDDSLISKDKKGKSNLRRNVLTRKVAPPAKRQKTGRLEDVDVDDDGRSIDGRSEATESELGFSGQTPQSPGSNSTITPILHSRDEKVSHTRPIYPNRATFTLYANSSLYGFFRLYELAYARLAKMKELSDDLARYPPRKTNPTAIELGLNIKGSHDPRAFTGNRYVEMIRLAHELVESRMDNTEFEDRMRHMYGTCAYLMFTIDKVLHAVVKQIQVMASEARTLDLLSLYYRDRENMTTSTKQEGLYKLAASGIMVEGESMYRLEYFIAERVLTIQLVSNDEATDPDTLSSEQRWSLYVDRYVQAGPTDASYKFFLVRQPFLKRLLPAAADIPDVPIGSLGYISKSNLEIKITVNTFRLFYVSNAQDVFYRPMPSRNATLQSTKKSVDLREAASQSRKIRSSNFNKWLTRRVQRIDQELQEIEAQKELDKARAEAEQQAVKDAAVATDVVISMDVDSSPPKEPLLKEKEVVAAESTSSVIG
ncbi:hypothetical protein SeMB42_g05890 [Synchytrium endobioticum]|uniref:Histone deacetylase interacting domain-containing protein n=1 Tax=Synchytrium endobioticum TaxID=286115 RepID=A0A507CNP5_9FUNG|nr:hypothetical protein SeMB42_g05890 [Synchytrium endobioticum]